MGYPNRSSEREILESHRHHEPVDDLQSVVNRRQVLALQAAVQDVDIASSLHDYILSIAEATRNSEELHVGVSTRGVLSLARAAQALALLEHREFVIPDDIKRLTVPVLSHRVIAKAYLHGSHRSAVEALIDRLVATVPVPD